MNLGNVPDETTMRRALLAKLLAPVELVLGGGAARLLMTPVAVPTRCSSLSVSGPNLRPATRGCRSWLTQAPGRRARTCSLNGRISFLYFCPRIFSCRMYGSRRGVCTHKETCNLQRASVSHVAVVKLKWWHHCVNIRLFSMWTVTSSGFFAHFSPWEMCQAVLIQHDLIRSAWLFERSWTRCHRFFQIFQRLWADRHL